MCSVLPKKLCSSKMHYLMTTACEEVNNNKTVDLHEYVKNDLGNKTRSGILGDRCIIIHLFAKTNQDLILEHSIAKFYAKF